MGKNKDQNRNKHSRYYEITGVLDITRSGLGFVTTSDAEGDVLVRPADFNKVFHGDRVRVAITRDGLGGRKREGKITAVLPIH